MTKKISAILLSLLMMVVFVPVMSSAVLLEDDAMQDLTTGTATTANVPGSGWFWNYSHKELTLEGHIYLNTPVSGDAYGFKVPYGTTIKIKSESIIDAPSTTSGDSYGIWALGDLTIERVSPLNEGQTLAINAGDAESGKVSCGIYCESADAKLTIDGETYSKEMKVDVSSKEESGQIYGIYGFKNMGINNTILNVNKSEVATEASGAAGISISGALVSTNSEVNVTTNDTTKENVGIRTKSVSADASKFDVLTGVVSNDNLNVAIYTDGFVKFSNSAVSAEAGDISSNADFHPEGKSAAIFVDTDAVVWTENTVLYTKAGNVENVEDTSSVSIFAHNVYMRDTTANAIAGYAKGASDNAYAIFAIGDFVCTSSNATAVAGSSSDANATNTSCAGIVCTKLDTSASAISAEAGVANKASMAMAINGKKVDHPGYPTTDKYPHHYESIDSNDTAFNLKSADLTAASSESYGLYSRKGYISFENSPITAEAGKADSMSAAICFIDQTDFDYPEYIQIYGGNMNLKASNSTNGSSYGLYSYNDCIEAEDIECISAEAGEAKYYSAGIFLDNYRASDFSVDLNLMSTNVHATGKDASTADPTGNKTMHRSSGIFVRYGEIKVKDSDIVAHGGKAYYSDGICTSRYDDYTIPGADWTRESYYDDNINEGDMVFSHSNIDATASEAEYESIAVNSSGKVLCNDTNTPESKGTVITADAHDAQDVVGISAYTGVNMYETTLNLSLNNPKGYLYISDSAWYPGNATGIEAFDADEDYYSTEGINLVDCKGTIDIDANNEGYASGLYVNADSNYVRNLNVIDCDFTMNLNNCYGADGIYNEGGNVKVTNSSDENDEVIINITDEQGDSCDDGIGGTGSVKISGPGKTYININNTNSNLGAGIFGTKKTTIDGANIEVVNEDRVGIIAGWIDEIEEALSAEAEPEYPADLTIKGTCNISSNAEYALVSTGKLNINYRENTQIHAKNIGLFSLGKVTLGNEDKEAFFYNAKDINNELIDGTSANSIPEREVSAGANLYLSGLEATTDDEDGMWIAFKPFNKYLVKFEVPANGVLTTFDHVYVEKGHKIGTYPTVSANSGYKFVGWYTNEALINAWNDSVVNSNVTLYAKIVQNSDPTPGPTPGPTPDPTPTPTPVPEDIEINVDPVPSGTDITSETVGENIEIKDKDKTLVEGKDYVVYVDKSTKSTVGYKAVSVIGIGNYDGVKTTTYIKVLPKKAAIKSITAGEGKLTYKWKKVAGVDNYVVRIATNKNFTKGKVVKYTKGTTTAKTFKNLKSGKKYYVQVRALTKNIENPTTHKLEKFYGNWSKVKSITVK